MTVPGKGPDAAENIEAFEVKLERIPVENLAEVTGTLDGVRTAAQKLVGKIAEAADRFDKGEITGIQLEDAAGTPTVFIRFLRHQGELPLPVTAPSASDLWPMLGGEYPCLLSDLANDPICDARGPSGTRERTTWQSIINFTVDSFPLHGADGRSGKTDRN